MRTLGEYESIPTSLNWKENTLYMACANGSLQMVTDLASKTKASSGRNTRAKTAAKKNEEAPSNQATEETAAFKPESKASAKPALKVIVPSELEGVAHIYVRKLLN